MALSLKERKKYNGTFFEGKEKYNGTFFEGKEKGKMALLCRKGKTLKWHLLNEGKEKS